MIRTCLARASGSRKEAHQVPAVASSVFPRRLSGASPADRQFSCYQPIRTQAWRLWAPEYPVDRFRAGRQAWVQLQIFAMPRTAWPLGPADLPPADPRISQATRQTFLYRLVARTGTEQSTGRPAAHQRRQTHTWIHPTKKKPQAIGCGPLVSFRQTAPLAARICTARTHPSESTSGQRGQG